MTQHTFFFYDLETSGFDPRTQRIVQFAGQRTDMDLNPIGEPVNLLVKLSEEVLPEPGAVLITGITPQKTHEEGYTEAEFLKILHDKVIVPNTIFLGFNSVRFDDEFMRYLLYRNFYDPYEWHWRDGCSRWDMLDVVRMTRALRPNGIEWPLDAEGRATNRLELISAKNGLIHTKAHDALSDVEALIAVAKLIREKQPKLFEFLLKNRSKQEVAKLVNLDDPQPFVYASGRYPKDHHHTTAALPIAPGGKPGSVIVYDLRHDPDEWASHTIEDLKKIRFATFEMRKEEGFRALPAKELSYNKCPAIAPLGVLDSSAQSRINLEVSTIQKHFDKLQKSDIADKLREVFARDSYPKASDVDAQLYDGFFGDSDKLKMNAVRNATDRELADFNPLFADERLPEMLLRYKARNYPHILSEEERSKWEDYRSRRLGRTLPVFMQQLQKNASTASDEKQFLLQELQLWAESIVPAVD